MPTARVLTCLFFFAISAARTDAQTVALPGMAREVAPEVDIGRALSDTAAVARQISRDLRTGRRSTSQRELLASHLERIRANDLLIRARHADLQRALDQPGSGGAAPARLAEAAAAYRAGFERLGEAVEETSLSLAAQDPGRLRTAVDRLLAELDARTTVEERTPLGVSLPFRSLGLPPVAPSAATAIVPAYADARFREPMDDDLRAAADAPLSAEIVEQARTLGNDPIAIFEFVQNEIDIEFYHGAMKGPAETLRQKRGNDVDQASLLVALMRASTIPARYVRGVVVLTAAEALAWTGLSGAQRAADLLAAAGIPFRTVIGGGTIATFEVEHTWVEVAVPYSNYRGARITPDARSWIPLDPSFKRSAYAPGVDLLDQAGFSGEAVVSDYLSAVQTVEPLVFLRQRVADLISRIQPDATYARSIGQRTLQKAPLGLLPNTLPYVVASVFDERATLPDALRHRIRFTARTERGTSFDVTIPASEIVGRRITLSYIADTVDDQSTIDSFLGLDNTPAYLVRLRPVLKVGGVVRAAGEQSAQMGASHQFSIEVQAPGVAVPIDNMVVAGGYYAIAFGGTHVRHDPAAAPASDDHEEGAGDLLYTMAADFLERWNEAEGEIANILQLAVVRPVLSEVMVGTVHRRTLLFGQPQEMVWRGVFVDADLRISEVIPAVRDAHQPRRLAFRQLSALSGSMAESGVLEATLQVESISAARLIQLARAGGTAIRELDAGNAAAILPTLATADIVKTEISDGVRQGWQATIPAGDINHQAWSGIGYVLDDPADGSAGYFISGGLAGGMTTQDPATWARAELATRLGKPYAGKPNTNPAEAASIEIVPFTNHQDGVAGQPLAQPLIAWVLDARRRPVHGARVTFRVTAGGGDFEGSDAVTVLTDALGLASAVLTLGRHTGDAPLYVRANPGDEHVTRVGQNLVMAAVPSRTGPVALTRPFQALGHPGAPHQIVKVFGDGGDALAGTRGSTMMARLEDEHGNPISNADLLFTVLPAVPQAGMLPTVSRNLQITRVSPPCANPAPVLGQCGGVSELVVATSVFGAAVDPILGDTENTRFRVAAAVVDSAIEPQIFSQFSIGSRTFTPGAYQRPRLVMSRRELVNDAGTPVDAARVGTVLEAPLETVLYLLEDDYILERINSSCAPAPQGPACFTIVWRGTTRARPINNGRPDLVSFPSTVPDAATVDAARETATVTFTPAQGGGTTDPAVQNPGHGRFATRLTVGPAPMLNMVDSTAFATVWVPFLDLNAGTVTPVLASLWAGQSVGGFDSSRPDPSNNGPAPVASGFPTRLTHQAFGVRVTLAPPSGFRVDQEGTLTRDVALAYTIEPPEYRAIQADLDIFEIDPTMVPDSSGCTCRWAGLVVGSSKTGDGVARFFQGANLDVTRTYRLQMNVNRGAAVEFVSDPRTLAFLTGKATYTSYTAANGMGLLYNVPSNPRPVRGAQVWLLDAAGTIVDYGNTNNEGFYSFVPPQTAGTYRVRISAALGELVPHVVVFDNTNPNPATAPYREDCPVVWNPSTSATVNAEMKSGWDRTTLQYSTPTTSCAGGATGTRAAAPFAILDAIYQAEQTVKSIDPGVTLPLLSVYWSPNNTNALPANPATGAIGTTYFDIGEVALYVLGAADVDTDEYDAHVILHEWGHYFQFVHSRLDTPGDSHSLKQIVDPRVAFSEGFGNAFAAMLLDDAVYVDTKGVAQSRTLTFDVGSDSVHDAEVVTDASAPAGFCTGAPLPIPCTWLVDGYYSEASVQEVLWRLSKDLGFQWIQRTLPELKTTEGFATIFSFLHHLKRLVPNAAEVVDAVARAENIQPGDEYGDPAAQLYTHINIVPVDWGLELQRIGVLNVTAANGRPLQMWDRVWDPTPAPAQPQGSKDPARPTPCQYLDSAGTPRPCYSDNKLYDRVFLRFTIEEAGEYAIEVAPTSGATRFDGGDLAFRLYTGPNKDQGTLVDTNGFRAAEVLVQYLTRGTHLLEVTSWGSAARFTVRIHR